MKNKKYPIVGTVPISNRKIIERSKINTPNTQIHDCSVSWLAAYKEDTEGFLLVKLKSSLRKFCGRHHDLVDHYGISVSQMTTDMFHLS
jgi:hypothetical protein